MPKRTRRGTEAPRISVQQQSTDGSLRLARLQGHQTLEEMVYAVLRASVTSGDLRPGQRIPVSELARQLGVSRLPVIHALRRLASEGFVDIHPHREAVIADPTPEDIRERALIIAALETLATREALKRLDAAQLEAFRQAHERFCAAHRKLHNMEERLETDMAFHFLLWRVADMRKLYDLLKTLWDQGGFYRGLYFEEPGFVQDRIGEHERILRAIEAGDSADLNEALYVHHMNSLDRIVSALARRR